MSAFTDKLLAAALGQADAQMARTASLGRLVWKAGSHRCYEAQREEVAVLTILGGPGTTALVYEIVGINVGELR